jgi:butyryl-CoA dehydrogenase
MNFDLNEEQVVWQEVVHDFVARAVKPFARQVDEDGQINLEVLRKMAPLGLLGLATPEEYGGAGVDAISAALAIEELGWGCGSTALSVAAHNGLGCAPLALFGSQAQKQAILPAVSKNGRLIALALTEPGGGSDLQGGVQTRAQRRGDDWVLNGSKMWITNASLADYVLTLARLDSATRSPSFSLFIVPTSASGLYIAPPEKKMGVKGSPTHAITYEDVHIPAENLLGTEGRGLSQCLTILDGGRISIAALSLGLARAAYEEGLAYAKERQAFGGPIANQQAIQWMLADAATEIHSARWMVYQAAWLKDQGRSFSRQAAMAKLLASETAERVCRNTIQIFGGYGYSREYAVERIYRDARLMTIGEGTSEILRIVIARDILKGES